MKNNRLFSLLLAVLMLLTAIFPMAAFAEEIFWDELYEQEAFDENWNEEILVEQEVPFVEEYIADENWYEETNDPANEDVLIDDGFTVTEEYSEPETVVEDAIVEEKADVSDEPVAEETEEERTELVLENTDEFLAAGLTVTNPAEQTVAEGGTATFSVTASGGTAPYTYQWYTYTTKWVKTGLGGGTTASISFDALKNYNGRKFKCVVKDAAGATKTTAEALLTVEPSAIVLGDFVFKKIDDTNNLALIEYTGNASSIIVPGSVDNMTVTEIGVSPLAEGEKGVFEGNTTLTSVSLPNSITAIREKSFKGCTNLGTMTTY